MKKTPMFKKQGTSKHFASTSSGDIKFCEELSDVQLATVVGGNWGDIIFPPKRKVAKRAKRSERLHSANVTEEFSLQALGKIAPSGIELEIEDNDL
jgi:hypothetical protein